MFRGIFRRIWKPGLLLIVVSVLVKVYLKDGYSDFEVYYRTAVRCLNGRWGEIYSFTDGDSPYRYSPLVLPFLIPYGFFNFDTARVLWALTQILFFILGFGVLYLILSKSRYREKASDVIALSVVLAFRYLLDAMNSGQITGYLFLFSALSLWFVIHERHGLSTFFIGIMAAFKIGPGIFFGVSFPKNGKALWVGALALGCSIILLKPFFGGWMAMVQGDGRYFDSNHYANQSFYGAYLEYFSRDLAKKLWLASSALLVSFTLGVWFRFPPKNIRSAGLRFSLGMLVYLLCMPQTFKHAMPLVAIPLVFLLLELERKNVRLLIFIFFLFLSLPGKDVVGDYLFFGIQHARIPFVVLVSIYIVSFFEIRREARRDESAVLNPGVLWTSDDWGYCAEINRAILELAKRGLVKRISVMTERPFFNYELDNLRSIPGLTLGLHYDLTENNRFPGPGKLMVQWYLNRTFNRSNPELLKWALLHLKNQLEIARQAGLKIEYLDGHHHAHLLPGFIDAAQGLLKEYKITQVRLPLDWTLLLTFKAPVVLMAFLARKSFTAHGLVSLPFIYPLEAEYQNLWFLRERLEKTTGYESICHPCQPFEAENRAHFGAKVFEYKSLLRAASPASL